ncbi:MAG: RnfABCDGE type electron transport complex subunit D [Planctomycetes bacterium]|nr:RnfABCDGE type electron transport complex subunit D [Planctomycetota bacterium]
MAEEEKKEPKKLLVSSSPHLTDQSNTQGIMIEVIVWMLPAIAFSVYNFQWHAGKLLIACLVGCVGTELLFNLVRKKPISVVDFSAVITAIILALSLPPQFKWYFAMLGSVVAIGVAKMLFGGLGSNIFNPAMVGRAFLAACFGVMMNTWIDPLPGQLAITYIDEAGTEQWEPVSGATPLSIAKKVIKDAYDEEIIAGMKDKVDVVNDELMPAFLGNTGGSIGEASAMLWLLGGLLLIFRRIITYHIPLAVLGSAGLIAAFTWWLKPEVYPNPLVHLCGGGLMMCAFFIATDLVTCPMSKLGRVIFGVGVGSLIMLIRLVGGYPVGVMYALLLMNAMTPLLDRWTRPKPIGGHARAN